MKYVVLFCKGKPNSKYISKAFQQKAIFSWEKCGFFSLFSEDKGDYIDVWMIKIRIKQIKLIWMDGFLLLSKVDNIQNRVYWFVNSTLTDKHGAKHL